MGNVIQYEHVYSSGGKSATVFVDEDLKGKHKEHCLCWRNCANFKPMDREHNCPIANALFALCVEFDLVTPVWECPLYEAKKIAEEGVGTPPS